MIRENVRAELETMKARNEAVRQQIKASTAEVQMFVHMYIMMLIWDGSQIMLRPFKEIGYFLKMILDLKLMSL